jgi:hypothetical protein
MKTKRAFPKAWLPCAALVFGGLAAFSPQAQAQGGVPLWTNRYNGPTNIYDGANKITAIPQAEQLLAKENVGFQSGSVRQTRT